MAFLTVAGITVSVSPQGTDMKWTLYGDQGNAFDGSAIGTINARKRVWSVQTTEMTTSAAATLSSALRGSPPVTMSGDWVGGASISVVPSLTSETPQESSPIMIVLVFTLTEA